VDQRFGKKQMPCHFRRSPRSTPNWKDTIHAQNNSTDNRNKQIRKKVLRCCHPFKPAVRQTVTARDATAIINNGLLIWCENAKWQVTMNVLGVDRHQKGLSLFSFSLLVSLLGV
jgi:hypothetical protein